MNNNNNIELRNDLTEQLTNFYTEKHIFLETPVRNIQALGTRLLLTANQNEQTQEITLFVREHKENHELKPNEIVLEVELGEYQQEKLLPEDNQDKLGPFGQVNATLLGVIATDYRPVRKIIIYENDEMDPEIYKALEKAVKVANKKFANKKSCTIL